MLGREALYLSWMKHAGPDFVQSLIRDPGTPAGDRLWAELAGNLNQDLNQGTAPLGPDEVARISALISQDSSHALIVSGPDASADAPALILINDGDKLYLALATGDEELDAVWPVTKDAAEIRKLWEQARAQAPADPPAAQPPSN